MKQSILRYLAYLFYLFIMLSSFLFSPEHTLAQSGDCDSGIERGDFPIYLYDQRYSVRYGVSSCPTVNHGASISRNSGIQQVNFTCGPHADENDVQRAFVATLYRCRPGTAVFTVNPPPNMTCENSIYWYRSTDNGSWADVDLNQPPTGSGCTVSVPYPPGEWDNQVLYTLNLVPPPLTGHTCNSNGTATIRWGTTTGAVDYGWRLNDMTNPWYTGSTDLFGYTSGNSWTVPIVYGRSYQYSVTASHQPGRHPIPISWSAGFTCPAPPVATNTPIPQLQIRIRNPQGAAVTVPRAAFTYDACSGSGLCLSSEVSNASSHNANTIGGWTGGGGIVLNSDQRLLGVTPNPGGGSRVTRNYTPRNEIWNNYWWSNYPNSGTRTLNFIVATVTPTPIPLRTLTRNVNPANSGSIECSTTSASSGFGSCATSYPHGTTVYVRAVAGANYNFSSWSGSCTGTSTTCALSMTANRSVTANFVLIQRTLTLVASPSAGGSFQCSTTSASSGFGPCATSYPHGTTVYVRTTPASNYRVTGWSGSCTGTSTSCTLSMTANRSATATFVLMPDLVPCPTSPVTRAQPSSSATAAYTIRYRNNGPGVGTGTFSIRVTNRANTPNTVVTVPNLSVPAVSSSCTSITVTCSSLGDSFGGINCNENSIIDVLVDSGGTITETVEDNNSSNNNTFTAVAGELLYKLKDASLHRQDWIDVGMPASITAYDADDAPSPLNRFVMGSAGVVTSTETIRIIGGDVSTNNFRKDAYTDNDTYLSTSGLSNFLAYANAQKPTKVITALNQIESNKVNIFGTGTQTLNINVQPAATDFVLLVNGNVTITTNPTFNTTADNSIAIIATGTITIANNVSTVNAILIGNNIVIGTGSTELKINGNLISNTPLSITSTTARDRTDNTKPNLFIVFKPKMYLDLLPHLSDITVEGRQVQ